MVAEYSRNGIANYCPTVVDAVAVALIRRPAKRAEVSDRISRFDRLTAQARSETHQNNRRQADGYPVPCLKITFE